MGGPVVCGVDGSDGSRDAIRVAGELADRLGTRLVVAHVAQLPVTAGYDVLGQAHLATDFVVAAEAGHGVLERAVARTGREVIDRRLLTGVPAEQLAELAELEDAVLIVVGSRGRGPFRAAFLGSVSALPVTGKR